jgi:hypothetical protein
MSVKVPSVDELARIARGANLSLTTMISNPSNG